MHDLMSLLLQDAVATARLTTLSSASKIRRLPSTIGKALFSPSDSKAAASFPSASRIASSKSDCVTGLVRTLYTPSSVARFPSPDRIAEESIMTVAPARSSRC